MGLFCHTYGGTEDMNNTLFSKTFISRVCVALALLALASFVFMKGPLYQKEAQTQILPPPSLSDGTRLAADALQHLMLPSGAFVYRVRLDDAPVRPKYNNTRHAGVMYALNLYETKHPSPALEQTLSKGLGFLKQQIRPLPDSSPKMSAIMSTPEKSKEGKSALGATALGLVAFLTAPPAMIDDNAQIASLGNFLLSMQRSNGSFYSRYYLSTNTRDDKFGSLYYPGETALAFTKLYAWDKSPNKQKWGNAARSALLYLARSRAETKVYPPDNWALVATKDLLKSGIPLTDKERAELIEHAERVIVSDVSMQLSAEAGPALDGAYTPQGNTPQTSARLEGLLSALTYIQDPALRARLEPSVVRAMSFLRKSQVREGAYAGAFTKTVAVNKKSKSHLKVRIDYIQHALSAMLQYEESGLPNQ